MHNKLIDNEIWDLILKNKALIYKYIYKYTKYDVDDVWQDVAIKLFTKIQQTQEIQKKGNIEYLPVIVESLVINALKKMNKDRSKIVYVDEDTIDYVMTGGVVA